MFSSPEGNNETKGMAYSTEHHEPLGKLPAVVWLSKSQVESPQIRQGFWAGLGYDKAAHPEEIEREAEILFIVVFEKCFHNLPSIATSASPEIDEEVC